MQGQIPGNARGVVVLMARGAGDDPGQTDGIEEGHGAVLPPGLPEGILQGREQQAGIFRRIGRWGQDKAADIATDISFGNAVSRAAVGKAQNLALFLQNKGILRGEVGMTGEQRAEGVLRQGGKAHGGPGGVPQVQQGGLIVLCVITNHFLAPHRYSPHIFVGAAWKDQPLTAPMVTPSMKYFCKAKNITNIGRAETVAPAIMGAKRVSFANLNCFRPT